MTALRWLGVIGDIMTPENSDTFGYEIPARPFFSTTYEESNPSGCIRAIAFCAVIGALAWSLIGLAVYRALR